MTQLWQASRVNTRGGAGQVAGSERLAGFQTAERRTLRCHTATRIQGLLLVSCYPGAAGGKEAVGISLWDEKENADAYARTGYPEVMKNLNKFVEGSPKVQTYEVVNSTFHKMAAAVAA